MIEKAEVAVMIKLSYIQKYVTLAETLNYTKAAEKLFTAQST